MDPRGFVPSNSREVVPLNHTPSSSEKDEKDKKEGVESTLPESGEPMAEQLPEQHPPLTKVEDFFGAGTVLGGLGGLSRIVSIECETPVRVSTVNLLQQSLCREGQYVHL